MKVGSPKPEDRSRKPEVGPPSLMLRRVKDRNEVLKNQFLLAMSLVKITPKELPKHNRRFQPAEIHTRLSAVSLTPCLVHPLGRQRLIFRLAEGDTVKNILE
ncbi:MAG: hypothetical protein A2W91_13065 [Bacteroidetes bacterium GWF2_38_335]|nr:MAG: hypothetical protein A2W91_13065 [Bacteroidetes bacterium GWF2_38_335]HBS85814.1 hypothetical protein [Bacteroidales bacterium]